MLKLVPTADLYGTNMWKYALIHKLAQLITMHITVKENQIYSVVCKILRYRQTSCNVK